MGALSERLKRASSRAGRLALGGALAVAVTPALAFAADTQAQDLQAQSGLSTQHYTPDYVDMVLIDKNGNPKGEDVELIASDAANHTYKYKGIAHSDGSHYRAYSVYTEITTDDKGVLTNIDLTSGNDTFSGTWGYNATLPVEGLLPKGVQFNEGKADDGTYSPNLSGENASSLGWSLDTVTLMSTSANGKADARGTDQNPNNEKSGSGRNAAEKPHNASLVANATNGYFKDGVVTVPAGQIPASDGAEATTDPDYYNLVKCTFTIGSPDEKMTFNAYIMTGGAYENEADGYLDNIAKKTFSENPTKDYTTNRDGWTTIMGTMMLRQLGSWGATLADSSKSTGDINGEIEMIDTVSGATKTSQPVIAALKKAKDDGLIKGVSENVKFTVDGANAADAESLPSLRVNNDAENNSFQDQVKVTQGEDGLYTVEGSFNKTGSGGRLSLDAIWLYDMNGQKLGTQGIMALAKETIPVADNPFADYLVDSYRDPKFDGVTGEPHLISFGNRASELTKLTEFASSNGAVPIDAGVIDFSYTKTTDAGLNYVIKIKNPNVTHLVMTYTLGHARASSTYDLAEQAKVPNVTSLLQAADASNVESVAKARAAYDSLTYDVRPFTTGLSKLIAAEQNVSASDYAEQVEAAKKSIEAHTVKSVVLEPGSFSFTGEEHKPAVKSVKAADDSDVSAADYVVAYNDNINAGDASVTVMGKGEYSGSASASFKIAQVEQSISAASANLNKTFGDAAFDLGVTASAGADVAYVSSNDKVATVDADGKVTIVGVGSAGITATANPSKNYSNTVSTTVKLSVAKAAQSISANGASKTFGDAAFALGAKLTKGDGKLSFGTSNAKVATVDNNGKVTIKGAGSAVITVKAAGTDNYNAADAAATVKVAKAANKVTLQKATKKVALKKVKTKAQTVAIGKAAVSKGAPAATYSIAKVNKAKKNFSINAKTGKITVKKGTAKGAYRVTVKATSGNANYKTANSTAVITINVR